MMTLLVVDDHPSFRTFARTLLASDAFERLHPDVVLLDVQLGDGIDGFEVARRLAGEPDPPRVVLTSSREASDYGHRLAEAPARGFIPKRELSPEALSALVAA
jgi:two-component system, NarL family, nitrate/nitrite response regulator NarL